MVQEKKTNQFLFISEEKLFGPFTYFMAGTFLWLVLSKMHTFGVSFSDFLRLKY